ncbi:MAG: AsnC family transcriptional regulator [Desulfomonilaceae bacterium]
MPTSNSSVSIDEVDRALLNEVQSAFPVESHPFRILGQRIGISEQETLTRVDKLRRAGIIRRIGASINSRGLGFVSTLVTATVPVDQLEDFVSVINSFPGVTHNYLRKHRYNVWFTLIAPSEQEKKNIVNQMSDKTGIELHEFPANRIFKIRVDFKF